jgi:predicted enzyme involved in methoxymalonyl-ACP biosynthesis
VLGRGVEQFLINHVVDHARQHGFEAVRGLYLPTAKNGMVRELYAQFGFACAGEAEGGGTRWRLPVAAYRPCPTHIQAT